MSYRSSFSPNHAIAGWRSELAATASFTEADLLELEDHLRTVHSEYLRSGEPPETAFELACRQVGHPVDLAPAYARTNYRIVWMERIQMALLGLATQVALWLSMVYAFQFAAILAYLAGLSDGALNGVLQAEQFLLLGAAAFVNGWFLLLSRQCWQRGRQFIERFAWVVRLTPLVVIITFAAAAGALLVCGKWYNTVLTEVIGQSDYYTYFSGLIRGFQLLLSSGFIFLFLRMRLRRSPATRLTDGRWLAYLSGGLSMFLLPAHPLMQWPVIALLFLGYFMLPFWLVQTVKDGQLMAMEG